MERAQLERYARQIILKEIGGAGQAKIGNAKVLIVGAGGLGGPAGLYLAASGAGEIGIIDEDVVELSNLSRQIQFDTDDIGSLKTSAMSTAMQRVNPHVSVREYRKKINAENALGIISGYDLVLDGTDDFGARFVVNEACLESGTPLVSGALGRFDGQLAAFSMNGTGPCYRCFVPRAPQNIDTCAAVGVVGALAGMIGSMMALEAVKIITGAGEPLFGKLFVYDGLSASGRTANLPKDPACPACGE